MKWNIQKRNLLNAYKGMMVDKYNDIGIGHTMAEALMNRRVKFDDIAKLVTEPESLLESPLDIKGCGSAAGKILDLIMDNYTIYIFADYDVDGLTSGFIMTDFINKIGGDAVVHYPERADGYGINLTFCKALAKKEGKKAVVTVDNGITAIEEIEYLNAHEIPVVVTDHHEPKAILPNCIVCDPWLPDNKTGRDLCGAGVAWKVCRLMDEIQNDKHELSDTYLPYVAVGTIADCMPMGKENMALVNIGLERLEQDAPNLQYLAQASKIRKVTPTDVGWTIGPKLNACGRMGSTITAGELLFADNENKKALMEIVKKIDRMNEQRKMIKNDAVAEASTLDFEDDNICFFDATEYPIGIAGIIANKLMEVYGKPAVVYVRDANGMAAASARSNGVDLLPLLEDEKRKGNIIEYGGHAQACGITLTPDIESFHKSMNEKLEGVTIPEPVLAIDSIIEPNDLRLQLVNDLAKIPTDKDNFPEIVFAMTDLRVTDIQTSKNNPNNLHLFLKDKKGKKFDVWGWGFTPYYESLGNPNVIDIAGTVKLGTFGKDFGKATFNIVDIRKAG